MKQQILELTLKTNLTFENFWVSERYQFIVNKLQQLAAGEVIYLWGKPSSGLTHLGQAVCCHYQQQGWPSLYLDLSTVADYRDVLLHALEGLKLIVLDNLETALGNIENEELLFNIYNRAMTENITLIWLAHAPPEQLNCQLADLKSRLAASLIFQLSEIGDEDKIKILQYCATLKGLKLPLPVAKYLLTFHSRELAILVKLLDTLDHATIAEKRKLTIPFIKHYLNNS